MNMTSPSHTAPWIAPHWLTWPLAPIPASPPIPSVFHPLFHTLAEPARAALQHYDGDALLAACDTLLAIEWAYQQRDDDPATQQSSSHPHLSQQTPSLTRRIQAIASGDLPPLPTVMEKAYRFGHPWNTSTYSS